MRGTLLLALLAIPAFPTPARAGGFAEFVGGIMIPVEDSDWTNYVESSPKLAARVGSVSDKIGGMLSVDWTPITTDNQGWAIFGNSVDVSANRFRILANVVIHAPVAKNLTASARLGAGIDIAHVSVESNIFGMTSSMSDTDSGIALEPGGGIWFRVSSVDIGAELALPIAFNGDGTDEDINQNDYTSVDIDLLFGVRLHSK